MRNVIAPVAPTAAIAAGLMVRLTIAMSAMK